MPRRLIILALGLFVGSVAPAAFAAEDSPAEAVLKSHELKRSATAYVLPAEAEVQKKLNEAKALYQKLSWSLLQERQVAYGASYNKGLIQQLTQQRIMLNQQLAQVSTVQENNRLVAMINEINDRINLMNEQASDSSSKRKGEAQVSTQREAFIQALLDLRQLVDQTKATYEELGDNEEIKSALDTVNQSSKIKFTLGPSKNFQANVKLLAKVESSVLTESIELKKEGGIYWVDATFNGKVTKPLAFDTGSSSVVLPAQFAASIGLIPTKDAPIVQAQMADGSVIEAKQMTIPSMRVGKFTVKDVVCIIMPADKKEAPPLLGQTFLKNFNHKFNSDTGMLFLAEVDVPEADKPAPKAKSAPRSSRPNAKRPASASEGAPAPGSPGQESAPNPK
jgi:clan AA aspartic protease (TIGR02281 family)